MHIDSTSGLLFAVKRVLLASSVAAVATCSPLGAQFLVPEPIPQNLIDYEPYVYNGHVAVRTFIFGGNASGALIHPRVFLTAAHVLFNANNLSWYEEIEYRSRQNEHQLGQPISATGSYTLSSYSDAVQQKGQFTIPWHFNEDIGAVYTVSDIDERYGAFEVATEGQAPLILGQEQKLILGYPLDATAIPQEDAFLLHQIQGELDFSYWLKHADPTRPNADPYDKPHATFAASGWRSYPGASGGPIYVLDDLDNRWVQVGVVITGNENNGSAFGVIRAIDETSYEVIEKAAASSGDDRPVWLSSITAEALDEGILIGWDKEAEFGAWEISRRQGDGWALIAVIDSSNNTFLDTGSPEGIVSRYRIRYRDGVNRGPWSRSAVAMGAGSDATLGAALNAPELHWKSGGNAPFFIDERGARSAEIGSNEESWLAATVEGPGTFTFSWSVSSEPGEEGMIYDSLSLHMNGDRVRLIEGEMGPLQDQIAIPVGVHELLFKYAKDLYVQEGDDLGRIHHVSFLPSSPKSPIVGSYSLSEGWRYSNWLGNFFQSGDSWIYSPGLGWMFAVSDASDGAYLHVGSNSIGWIWTSATAYPWVYSFQDGWLYHQHGSGWFWSSE